MASSTALPNAPVVDLGRNVILQPPLSRCGHGPGLIIIRPSDFAACQHKNTSLDPEPLQKWAEESYAVVQVTLDAEVSGDEAHVLNLVKTGMEGLVAREECNKKESFGLLVYGSKGDYSPMFEAVLQTLGTATGKIAAVVCFEIWRTPTDIPVVLHVPGKRPVPESQQNTVVYSYPEASSAAFTVPGHSEFKISSAGVAHTRSLTFLKKHMDGPYFDLEKIWDEHTYYEFGDRSVEKTMATMVQEPYVNHVPTLTGGVGRARLSKFYLEHFIFNNPEDTELELISRTVGTDRVVDEFIFCLTHNKEVDWLAPGIPPTGKPLRIPFTAVVNIRGDRLYHEHIAWDQATVLVQLGLLPEYLPYPYALPNGQVPGPGKRFEYRVPAAGAETAAKMQDEHLVPSNQIGSGKAIAVRLVQEGYSVCINDIPSVTTEIQNVVAEINAANEPLGDKPVVPVENSRPRAIGISADVTSSAAVEAMVKETVAKLGPLTLMVANAGVAQVKPLLEVTEEDVDHVMSINFKGVFNCYTHAARQMIAQGNPESAAGVGVYKIIGAASIVAHKPFPTLGIYSASKWAVRGMTQAMAMEMARHKITVNAYAPGIVGTAMWDEIDARMGEIEGRPKGASLKLYSERSIALGRTSVPEDVAGLVGGFLASKDSDYVTGQTMLVDGGIIFT
ncbi:hypothetical protein BDV59DRAFT_191839 [Aspergillus ambiguus]|uniref:uncharacterized protein n=1 Tax=Aspergillus ambiguus TaxID=176160 RepID=UPI003CCDAE61